jgi:hypothetical protein
LIHKASDFWIGRLATPLQRTFVPTSPQKYCGSLLAGRRGLLLWAEWRTGDGRCAAGCIKRCPLHLHLRCSLGLGPSLSAKCRAFRPAVCVELPFGERHCSRPWRHGANRQHHAVLLTRIELSPRQPEEPGLLARRRMYGPCRWRPAFETRARAPLLASELNCARPGLTEMERCACVNSTRSVSS